MRIRNADGSEVGRLRQCDALRRRAGRRERGASALAIETARACSTAVPAGGRGRGGHGAGPARLGDVPLARPMDTLHLDLAAGPLADRSALSMGNPHATFFVADAEAMPIDALGPRSSMTPYSPSAPISVSRRCSPRTTSACASGSAARPDPRLRHRGVRRPGRRPRRGLTGRRAAVELDGGDARDRVARRRPRADDRAGRDQLQRRDRSRGLSAHERSRSSPSAAG